MLGIVGSLVVVSWSFSLPNISNEPQTIEVGSTYTQNNYTPLIAVIKNGEYQDLDIKGFVGPDASNLTQIFDLNSLTNTSNTFSVPYLIPTNGNVHPKDNLYITYSGTQLPPENGALEVDIMAYPQY